MARKRHRRGVVATMAYTDYRFYLEKSVRCTMKSYVYQSSVGHYYACRGVC